jgi:hypothetical protein
MKNASIRRLHPACLESPNALQAPLRGAKSRSNTANGRKPLQNRPKDRHFRSYFAHAVVKAANLADIVHKCMAVA